MFISSYPSTQSASIYSHFPSMDWRQLVRAGCADQVVTCFLLACLHPGNNQKELSGTSPTSANYSRSQIIPYHVGLNTHKYTCCILSLPLLVGFLPKSSRVPSTSPCRRPNSFHQDTFTLLFVVCSVTCLLNSSPSENLHVLHANRQGTQDRVHKAMMFYSRFSRVKNSFYRM